MTMKGGERGPGFLYQRGKMKIQVSTGVLLGVIIALLILLGYASAIPTWLLRAP